MAAEKIMPQIQALNVAVGSEGLSVGGILALTSSIGESSIDATSTEAFSNDDSLFSDFL
jgi:hypothetical protein